MKTRSGKKWFYAIGQSSRAKGEQLSEGFFWSSHNLIPLWAYQAYMNGYFGI